GNSSFDAEAVRSPWLIRNGARKELRHPPSPLTKRFWSSMAPVDQVPFPFPLSFSCHSGQRLSLSKEKLNFSMPPCSSSEPITSPIQRPQFTSEAQGLQGHRNEDT